MESSHPPRALDTKCSRPALIRWEMAGRLLDTIPSRRWPVHQTVASTPREDLPAVLSQCRSTHMLSAVAADAEVDGVALTVVFGPNVSSPAFPALRDRIANEYQVDVTLGNPFVHAFVTLHPAAGARHRLDCVVLFRYGEGRAGKNQNSSQGKSSGSFHCVILRLVFDKVLRFVTTV